MRNIVRPWGLPQPSCAGQKNRYDIRAKDGSNLWAQRLSICSAYREVGRPSPAIPTSLTTVVYLSFLPSLTEDTAYLGSYQRARLDSGTIPEYFAPPGVLLLLALRRE
jgi:hypothetical protein